VFSTTVSEWAVGYFREDIEEDPSIMSRTPAAVWLRDNIAGSGDPGFVTNHHPAQINWEGTVSLGKPTPEQKFEMATSVCTMLGHVPGTVEDVFSSVSEYQFRLIYPSTGPVRSIQLE
jgi:hypothetical protein